MGAWAVAIMRVSCRQSGLQKPGVRIFLLVWNSMTFLSSRRSGPSRVERYIECDAVRARDSRNGCLQRSSIRRCVVYVVYQRGSSVYCHELS